MKRAIWRIKDQNKKYYKFILPKQTMTSRSYIGELRAGIHWFVGRHRATIFLSEKGVELAVESCKAAFPTKTLIIEKSVEPCTKSKT